MKITLLGAHNCETLDYRHTCFVVDDILAVDAGSLTAGLSLESQLSLNAVLLSHQHYDHVRDIVALGTNLFHAEMSIDIHTTPKVLNVLNEHFFTSRIYRNLAAVPEGNPTLRMNGIVPFVSFESSGFQIEAIPVNHPAETVGFRIVSGDGKELFYTADTGPGLSGCWERITPQVLIAEVTETNASSDHFRTAGHLTPALLEEELMSFQNIKGYLPNVVTVHMTPSMEDDIKAELAAVAERLGCRITAGYEGMQVVF